MNISFLISFYRLLNYIILGIKSDSELKSLLVFIIMLLIGSTLFYMSVEGWSAIDALYFSIMTMSTVGNRDLAPSTDLGKAFTMVYTFMSIGMFVTFTAKIIAVVLKKKVN